MGGTYHSEIFIFLKLIHVNYLVFFGKFKNFYKLIFLYKIPGYGKNDFLLYWNNKRALLSGFYLCFHLLIFISLDQS